MGKLRDEMGQLGPKWANTQLRLRAPISPFEPKVGPFGPKVGPFEIQMDLFEHRVGMFEPQMSPIKS